MTCRGRFRSRVRAFLVAPLVLATFGGALAGAAKQKSQAPRVDSTSAIHEEGYVRIGGIDQWLQVRGDHRGNPVLLWLNGGPGFSVIPSTPAYRAWEGAFTVVMWDQRGEGKTFERSGKSVASTMTIEKMTRDGIEVVEHLRKRLGKDKIILLGHSWGSILGVHMVKRRPDLFAAYVGTGQVVQLSESAKAAYPLLLERASALGNTEAESQLRAVGPPPYDDSPKKWVWVRWANRLDPGPVPTASQQRAANPSPPPAYIAEGADFSQGLMWESMLKDDLRALGLKFEIPIVLVQGAEDRLTVTALAKEYFDSISAPSKKFVVIPEVGHLAIFTGPDTFLRALVEHARGFATATPSAQRVGIGPKGEAKAEPECLRTTRINASASERS